MYRVVVPVLALLLLALPGCIGMGQRAEHVWTAELEPTGEGAYSLEIPFLAPAKGADPTLDALRQGLRVVEGEATVSWVADGTVLAVAAEGPVLLQAEHRFRGSTAEREAFSAWSMPTDEVRRSDGGGPPVHVSWRVDFSGGEGHTCWADATLAADVPGDGTGRLTTVRGEAFAPEDGARWATVCA